MTINNAVNVMAGTMVVLSFVLSRHVDASFVYLSLFVGVMLIQSAFTGFCPAAKVAKAMGAK